MSPAEACAERALDIADQVTRIRPLSRTRPHVFLEDKQALALALRKLAADIKATGRLPARAVPFNPGTIFTATGRSVRVERRRAA